jgi:LDH2 family malate/lactate/ureidoglycolate dehydrogenase
VFVFNWCGVRLLRWKSCLLNTNFISVSETKNPTSAPLGYKILYRYATALLQAAGCTEPIAHCVATVLIEGDLLGHDTHGLAQLPAYLGELEKGLMIGAGEITKTVRRPAVAHWHAHRLPGPYVVTQAIEWAKASSQEYGVGTVAIEHSHHIACLAAYLEAPARAGFLVEVFTSDPGAASVAPFGGTTAVMTPNPLAIGIPTNRYPPILIDVSASITTNAMTNRLAANNQRGAGQWWADHLGQPSDDPKVTQTSPPGTLLPLGGVDAGHKGFALGLMVEALTAGLSGFGRASDNIPSWGAAVLVRVTDPTAFGELKAFTRQTDGVVEQCLNNPPRDAQYPVRLPGHRGLERKNTQLQLGITLHPTILPKLKPWADKFEIQAL